MIVPTFEVLRLRRRVDCCFSTNATSIVTTYTSPATSVSACSKIFNVEFLSVLYSLDEVSRYRASQIILESSSNSISNVAL
jgi:hypothetical protein